MRADGRMGAMADEAKYDFVTWEDPGHGQHLLWDASDQEGKTARSVQCSGCSWHRSGSSETLCSSVASEELFPMFLLPVAAVLKLEKLQPQQELLARGWLVQYVIAMLGRVIFVTHQWLGWSHPDPEGVQLLALQGLLRTLMEGQSDVQTHWQMQMVGIRSTVHGSRWAAALPHMLCWLDYCSVPQPLAASEEAVGPRLSRAELTVQLDDAVRSIPAYVERAALMVVLVPLARHVDTGASCSISSWRSRGWCRMEYWSAALARNPIPAIVCGNRRVHLVEPTELALAPKWGDFTCCARGHLVNGRTTACDRAKVGFVLERLLEAKLASLFEEGRPPLQGRILASLRPWFVHGPPSGQAEEKPPEEQAQGHEDAAREAGAVAELKWALRWGSEAEEARIEQCSGYSLLHYAACSGNSRAARALLALRADVQLRTRKRCRAAGVLWEGMAPLHLAMAFAGWEVVETLLGAKAEPEQRCPLGALLNTTPLELACIYRRVSLVEAWRAHFPQGNLWCSLNWAARSGSLPVVKVLLAARAELGREMETGCGFALTWAAGDSEDADAAVVQALLLPGAKVNLRAKPQGRFAALCAAMRLAYRGGLRTELCVILANAKGLTPLHAAAGLNPNVQIIRMLLAARADPKAKNALGFRPLEYALCLGTVPAEVLEALDVPLQNVERDAWATPVLSKCHEASDAEGWPEKLGMLMAPLELNKASDAEGWAGNLGTLMAPLELNKASDLEGWVGNVGTLMAPLELEKVQREGEACWLEFHGRHLRREVRERLRATGAVGCFVRL